MPLYEYQCEACAHRFETIQKFSDAPISVCPKCGGPVEKLLSSPAIQFKGSGFYLTDYGRGTGKPESGSKADTSDSAAKAEGRSDAKSDSSKSDSSKSDAGKSDVSKSDVSKSDTGSTGSSGTESKSAGDTSAAKPAAKAD